MADSPQTAPPPERGSSLWPLALVLLLAAAVLLLVQLRRRPAESAVSPAQPLPPLTVAGWLNTAGPLSANDLRGQVVLVDCWASWCGPCVANMPEMVDLYQRYRSQGLTVIGLTTERDGELADLKAYVAQVKGLDWPIGYGADVPMDMLGVVSIPSYILFDRRGLSVWASHSLYGLDDAIAKALAKE